MDCSIPYYTFFFLKLFIYLLLAAHGLSLLAVRRLLLVVAFLVAEHGL